MPTPTYVALATFTATGTETSVTFGSIPSSFRDIVIMGRVFQNGVSVIGARFNSDSGSNYSSVLMRGDGSGVLSATYSPSFSPIWYSSNPTNGTVYVHIMDYSATDKHKTTLVLDNTDNNAAGAIATRWANTSAITTIEILSNTKTFQTGTTISIYGIEA